MREDQQAGVEGLEKLAAELDSADFEVRLVAERHSQWPSLHVRNRRARALSEIIYAGPDAFWRGWAQRIPPLADVTAAAAAVARVLSDRADRQ
jgi:hypothetical protein